MTGSDSLLANLPYFLESLLIGARMTVIVTAGGFVLSVILGILFALISTSGSRPMRALAYVYVEIFRAVPVLTQLFIIYFGLGAIGIRLDPVSAAIVGFGLNGGAYLSEVFRAGIQAIAQGQREAAMAIGMTQGKGFRYVILPQAMRIALPSLSNFLIGLLKDTSLASAVAAPEIMFRAHMLVDETYLTAQIYLMVAIIYLIMSLVLSTVLRRLERHLGRGLAR